MKPIALIDPILPFAALELESAQVQQINNPESNPVEFDGFRKQSGLNSFTLTPKQWTERTGAIGIQSKTGRYGGTYAHLDIALEFASWISVEFKLYLIKEYQRLKETERQTLGWDIRRNLAKINYRIHTDAVQTHLIPPTLSKAQTNLVYASESDVLNRALFGQTATQWRTANPKEKEKGNIRDQATGAQPRLLIESRKPQCSLHRGSSATTRTARRSGPKRQGTDCGLCSDLSQHEACDCRGQSMG